MKINKFMVKTLLVVFLICGVVGVAYADSIKDAQDKNAQDEHAWLQRRRPRSGCEPAQG